MGVEVFGAREVRFEHKDLAVIAQARGAAPLLEAVTIEASHAGLFFKDSRHEATLAPGAHAFWTFKVADPLKAVTTVEALARELDGIVRVRVAGFGIDVVALGIRDVILPGEMKDLMNKVTEAKKAAEAALITRREETAAMRSQANTAKILESSPTLMRLRELEVVEKVSEKANLTVVLGEKGLADRVVKLLYGVEGGGGDGRRPLAVGAPPRNETHARKVSRH